MKKLWFFALLFFGMFIFDNSVKAKDGDYTSFSEVNLVSGKLLANFTDAEIDEYDKKLDKKRFIGWNTNVVNKNVTATFISETLFSFYNDGATPIEYELQTVTNTTTKTSISCTGTIDYSLKGDVKKFKNGLDVQLKMDGSYTKTVDIKQTEKFKLNIDVGTMVVIYLTGTGKVTNGAARRYLFWIVTEKGGFEYFTITNLYPRIEKIKI